MIRLGGPVFDAGETPEAWVEAHRKAGYTAAFCPLSFEAEDAVVAAYARSAEAADLVIAEVGAWSNPLSLDPSTRSEALNRCKGQLELADRIGARCCVNIAGSLGEKWDGPDARDLTRETFDLIVETVREIIDAVKPRRTFYTLEPMPWMYPDSADSYLDLLKAVDRSAFAVHLDPVNMICSPQRYFANGDFIRDFIHRLGPHIRSCHAKDVLLQPNLTTHLDEVQPGLGGLDYRAYLEELDRLLFDLPLMMEHLTAPEQYQAGAEYIRTVARAAGVDIKTP